MTPLFASIFASERSSSHPDPKWIGRRAALSELGVWCSMAALSGAGAVGCAETDRAGTVVALPKQALVNLEADEFRVVATAIPLLVGNGERDPVDTAHRVDEALSAVYPENVVDIRAGILLIDNLAAIASQPRVPFTAMSAREGADWLESIRHSDEPNLRFAYSALRVLCVTAAYTDPASWDAIDYPGAARGVPSDVVFDSNAGVRS